MMSKEKIFVSSHIELNYVKGPNSGSPLLLLYGGVSRWQSFATVIPELAGNWHVFALDLRGHGKSSHTPEQYKIQDFILDIKSFIENCIKEPTIIFSHSLGGMVAIMVSVKYPNAVYLIKDSHN